MKRIDAAIAIVCRAQKVLICQRKDDDTLDALIEEVVAYLAAVANAR